MTYDVHAALDAAVAHREAVPGMPQEGPYPATLDEVADEVVEWVRRFERDFHRGFGDMVAERLIGRVGEVRPRVVIGGNSCCGGDGVNVGCGMCFP